MNRYVKRLESFLGLDVITTHSQMMRARAVYMIGGIFILTQVVNQVTMFVSYGAITLDHLISVTACVLVVGTILMLRRHKNFPVYAAIYSILIVLATFASALPENTGINSALIPFFILGIVTNGFICGWRSTAVFGAMSFVCVWALWWVSANYDYTPIFDVEKFADRNFQRAIQASLAIMMITLISGMFARNMHRAFEELESGIAQARSSDRAKTDFLAAMSHELCTPLNGIVGVSDVLSETDLDADQRELTEMIQSSSTELQSIISNVLLFSQLEAGKVMIADDPLDLSVVLNNATYPFLGRAKAKGLSLRMGLAPGTPHHVYGDRTRLIQVISSLLDNAIKFTSSGHVTVSIHSEPTEAGLAGLSIVVRDTGMGIAAKNQQRIFDRFTQVDGGTKREFGGTGLGLSVTKGLVELMGGTLSVQSETGKGSSFIVQLERPLAEPAAQTPSRAA